jgi:hypothetical protein
MMTLGLINGSHQIDLVTVEKLGFEKRPFLSSREDKGLNKQYKRPTLLPPTPPFGSKRHSIAPNALQMA